MNKFSTFYYYSENPEILDCVAIGEIADKSLYGYGFYANPKYFEMGNFNNNKLNGYGILGFPNDGSIQVARFLEGKTYEGFYYEQNEKFIFLGYNNREKNIFNGLIIWPNGSWSYECGGRKVIYDSEYYILKQFAEQKNGEPYQRYIRLLEAFDFDKELPFEQFTYDDQAQFDDMYYSFSPNSVFPANSGYTPGIIESDKDGLLISNFNGKCSDRISYCVKNNEIIIAEYEDGNYEGPLLRIDPKTNNASYYWKHQDGSNSHIAIYYFHENMSIGIKYAVFDNSNYNYVLIQRNGDVKVFYNYDPEENASEEIMYFKFGD